ncbi:MAG: hypothetical protein PHC61_09095 [Chitinivibrionales bacterium]|nr:hypothetical protein [Chitinivibrionales bacterium]
MKNIALFAWLSTMSFACFGATMTGSAQWLSESAFVAAPSETGRIGYLEAFGGDEYGYAYTYSLTGQPTALSVDADDGMLTIRAPIAAGTYNFTATVTNRKVTGKVATFPVTLTITSSIQVKTYLVDPGLYGSPAGSNYNTVLMNLRAAIIADQTAAGDEKLRATVVFHAGKLYQYTENRWDYGIQYLTLKTDSAGVRAQLQNIGNDGSSDDSYAILILGRGYFTCNTATTYHLCGFDHTNIPGYKINTNSAGTKTVTLKSAADASKLTIGRYVMIGSFDQQGSGWPPNVRNHEYARIASISGATITLDRNLRFSHQDNYYEGGDPNSLGLARIYAIDRSDERMNLRATVRDIQFLANTGTTRDVGAMVYSYTLDAGWENCSIPDLVPSMSRFVAVVGTTIGSYGIDFDKDMSMAIVDSSAVPGGIFEGTSLDYLLVRKSTVTTSTYGFAPRQLRLIGATMNGGSGFAPFTIISWGTQSIDILGSTLHGNLPPIGEWSGAALVIGTNGTWNGDTLSVVASTDYAKQEYGWLAGAWVGALVYNGTGRTSSWGYITKITGNGTNIYSAITWVAGSKPATGQTLYLPKLHDISVDATSQSNQAWASAINDEGQHVFPTATRQFPADYPYWLYGFGAPGPVKINTIDAALGNSKQPGLSIQVLGSILTVQNPRGEVQRIGIYDTRGRRLCSQNVGRGNLQINIGLKNLLLTHGIYLAKVSGRNDSEQSQAIVY